MEKNYSNTFRIQVAKEAAQPENQGLEQIIAQKYGVQPWTVRRWKNIYLTEGEGGFRRGNLSSAKKEDPRIQELEKKIAEQDEEIRILKKAAAFLASVKHE